MAGLSRLALVMGRDRYIILYERYSVKGVLLYLDYTSLSFHRDRVEENICSQVSFDGVPSLRSGLSYVEVW